MEYVFAFQFWYCELFVEKRWGGGRKHRFLVFEGWGRKSSLGPAETASFSSRDFSRSNKHDSCWHVVSTGSFYVLFLWAIAVSDFLLLEVYKNLGLPLSTMTFTVNSHADNLFYQNSNLFQKLYSIKSVSLSNYTLRFLKFKSDLNVKHSYFY